MITLHNNYQASQLLFQRRRGRGNQTSQPKHEPPKPEPPKPEPTKKSANNKLLTGAIATTAFIAGYGTNQLITSEPKSDKTEMAMTKNNKSNSNDITWEEAQNMPPKKGYRFYTTKDTINIDGKNYIQDKKFAVQETANLLQRTLKNAETGQTEQVDEFNNFITFPLKEKTTGADGKLIESMELDDFNYNLKAPTGGKRKLGKNDGTFDTYNVNYKIEMELKDKPQPKQQPKAKPQPKPQPKPQTEAERQEEIEDQIVNDLFNELF